MNLILKVFFVVLKNLVSSYFYFRKADAQYINILSAIS